MFQVTFESAVITHCNRFGTISCGVQAVVKRDGVEVFRSKAKSNRYACRLEASKWIAAQG